ncbi:putative mitochondrial protein [Sesamum angolense]|uniref:Mitochondrial protein n=1 Tax=Sesamum angolense TaxID=2727404 RepID=A0AAE1X7F1_9LAMI|nr:putative mitochondrial protein [Sesamum angolense]
MDKLLQQACRRGPCLKNVRRSRNGVRVTTRNLGPIVRPRSMFSKNGRWIKRLLLLNTTRWTLTPLPNSKKLATASKWVFKLKLSTDGSVDRYKARLMAKPLITAFSLNLQLVDFLLYWCIVDDIVIMGPSNTLINEVKVYLDPLFTIKDFGYAKYFLSFKIARADDGMSVAQHKYALDILTDIGWHWDTTLHVVRYSKGSTNVGLFPSGFQ